MANVVDPLDLPSTYRDHKSRANQAEQLAALSRTSTLYVGNLSFYTTEEQMHELFGRATDPAVGGGIKCIIMGLDRNTKTPCGFAFVEYYTHEEAVDCMRLISGTKLDERIIRCDLDPGYTDGRQYGRGRSGGQVRDEHRQEYDAGRGGWGHVKLKEDAERQRREAEEAVRKAEHDAVYMDQERESGGRVIPSGAEGQYEERDGVERGDEGDEREREGRKRDRSQDDEDYQENTETKHQKREGAEDETAEDAADYV